MAPATMASSVCASMDAPYSAALKPIRMGRPVCLATLIQSTHSPRRAATCSIQSILVPQKFVGNSKTHLSRTPNPSAPIAACAAVGRAGEKVTAPALRTPRGRVTMTRSASKVTTDVPAPTVACAVTVTVDPDTATPVTLWPVRMSRVSAR